MGNGSQIGTVGFQHQSIEALSFRRLHQLEVPGECDHAGERGQRSPFHQAFDLRNPFGKAMKDDPFPIYSRAIDLLYAILKGTAGVNDDRAIPFLRPKKLPSERVLLPPDRSLGRFRVLGQVKVIESDLPQGDRADGFRPKVGQASGFFLPIAFDVTGMQSDRMMNPSGEPLGQREIIGPIRRACAHRNHLPDPGVLRPLKDLFQLSLAEETLQMAMTVKPRHVLDQYEKICHDRHPKSFYLIKNFRKQKIQTMENVIILGTGCAGFTAGIYAARANLNPLILEGKQPGGQLTTTSEVENFPGFPEGIDGYDLMSNLRKQAIRFGARVENAFIDRVDFDSDCKRLYSGEKSFEAKVVIIATGAAPRLLGIPGEQEMYGGKGVTTCATCDGAFYRNMEVVVVGGGDSACEEALFLTRFCSKVTLVHRRDQLRASRIMAERTLAHDKIDAIWDSAVEEILPDENGRVRGVLAKNLRDGSVREVSCKGVFIAIGHLPNTQPFKGILELDENGYLLPSAGSMVKTSVPGVFVAGDCADHVYRQAITAAGMGCQAAIEAERWLAESD